VFKRINLDRYSALTPRLRFVEGDAGAAGDAAGATGSDTGATATGATDASAGTVATATAEKVEDLPSWAQKIITDTRKEAGDYRTAAKTAADNAQKELTDKLAVALGLKPDASLDPAALTASLTEAQSKATRSARELAIFKAAAATGADPSRLLDSNSFMSSVSGLDPADGAAVTAAITAAVAANPNLKAVLAAAASGTELGGTGETGQITEAQLAQMSPEEKVTALKAGKLQHLLT
jgi:alkylhydroperoxidase family enzyme